MKQLKTYFSIFCIAAILGGISWQTATIVDFYAHQDDIEKEHCVNKDKPELSCHGKCHLKAKLKTKVTEQSPKSNRTLASSLLVFQGFECLCDALLVDFDFDHLNEFQYSFSVKTAATSGLLDPPETC